MSVQNSDGLLARLPPGTQVTDTDSGSSRQSQDDNNCWANPRRHFAEYEVTNKTEIQLVTKDEIVAMKEQQKESRKQRLNVL